MTTAVAPRLLRTPAPDPRLFQRIWDRVGWVPYPMQSEVLLDRTRNKVWAAGRRAGKSRVGGHRLLPETFRAWYQREELRARGLRREYWIVGPEYSDSEKEFRVVWDGVARLGFPLDHPGTYNNTEAGDMRISLFGGACIIHAKSGKHPETLVGEGLSGVVFSEAAKLKPSVYWKFIRPTLADFGGWSHFGSTPEGKNWFYDLWGIGQDPEREDWMSWRTPSWLNHHVYPGGCDERLLRILEEARDKHALDEIKRVLRWTVTEGVRHPIGIDAEIWALWQDMPGENFNQEEAALFSEYVGRVFKDFDEELHVVNRGFDPAWATYACVDYGFTNPTAWLLIQVDPAGERVHVLDEYYESGRSPEEAAEEIRARGLAPRSIRAFYPDPADPGATRTLAEHLRLRPASPGSLSVHDRIQWIRKFLKPGAARWDGGPALTIERGCVNTIREFGAYRYKETPEKAAEKDRAAPENPLKKDDHTPEALGRFFSGYFGVRAAPSRQRRVRTSRPGG